ncbi:MAG: hypothetical protein WCR44_05280 [Verrucomicrobiota bacterium]
MLESIETITIEGKEISVFLPTSYNQTPGGKFPILLMLTPGLKAQEAIAELHVEGVLPEMIVAEVLESEVPTDSIAIIAGLAERFRLLDSSSARWIGGTGHAAVDAFRALLDHPEIFSAACCLSTSFEGVEGAPPPHSPMLLHLEERKSLPAGSRIYFDYGTIGLDECYEPYHRDLGAILRCRGWKDGEDFQIHRHTGGSQDITSWQQRIGPALHWLARR